MYTLSPKTAAFRPYDPIAGQYPIRLDANESFLLPTETDRAAMTQAAAEVALNRYPDPLAGALCAAFAARYGLDAGLVTAFNGSDELIGLLMACFLAKGERVAILDPDFSMYQFYTAITETPPVIIPKNAGLQIDADAVIDTLRKESPRLLIFSNPCNPTSLGLPRTEVLRILDAAGDCLVAVDEAYMDFWDQSVLDEVPARDNLIVLRTCSKAVGLAALRIGFAVASPTLTQVLRAAKSPYNVNAVSAAMAAVVLRNPFYADIYTDLLLASRKQLTDRLGPMAAAGRITRLFESRANFVFIELDDASTVWQGLADRGIIVRRVNERYLRITAGTQAENNRFLAAFTHLTKARESI